MRVQKWIQFTFWCFFYRFSCFSFLPCLINPFVRTIFDAKRSILSCVSAFTLLYISCLNMFKKASWLGGIHIKKSDLLVIHLWWWSWASMLTWLKFMQFIGNYQETIGVKSGWGAGKCSLPWLKYWNAFYPFAIITCVLLSSSTPQKKMNKKSCQS